MRSITAIECNEILVKCIFLMIFLNWHEKVYILDRVSVRGEIKTQRYKIAVLLYYSFMTLGGGQARRNAITEVR